jgi:hypothetical protein
VHGNAVFLSIVLCVIKHIKKECCGGTNIRRNDAGDSAGLVGR